MEIRDEVFDRLTVAELHGILRLRSAVFVVEQNCVYLDLDGRDDEPRTRHVWIERDAPVAYLRMLDDGGATRIGRVATRPEARGHGLAAALVRHALATSTGPWVLGAQCPLEDWYRSFGFERAGPDYDEDGIPHVPMRRDAP